MKQISWSAFGCCGRVGPRHRYGLARRVQHRRTLPQSPWRRSCLIAFGSDRGPVAAPDVDGMIMNDGSVGTFSAKIRTMLA
jgi:hypothetical protein